MNRTRSVIAPGAIVVGLLALNACDLKDRLLEPQQPQVISPVDVQNATGADAMYVGALGELRTALNGGNNNRERLWGFEGLISDEFRVADTFAERIDADQRNTKANDGVMGGVYNSAQQARGRARDAINALTEFEPDAHTKLAEMYLMMGFLEMSLSQDFCNGIPFGETIDGVVTYTAPITNEQGFQLAIARFDTALTLLGSASDDASISVRYATLVAKGRAQVDLGQFDAAAATVGPVPTDYQYLLTYSTQAEDNEWYQMQPNVKRYTVGDAGDATNALPFASANDPRLPVDITGETGEDNETPYNEMQIYIDQSDPIAMVSGLDAKLIQAEAALNDNDIPGMMSILNGLRTDPPLLGAFQPDAMGALPEPTSPDAAVDLFFREKAFWQFARGERLSDLRRLVRQYGRDAESVFPTGDFPKGGKYGTGVNFPVPDSERSNPNFQGCLDRKA